MSTYAPTEPTNDDDVIDSRDVIHWLEEYATRDEIANDPETPEDERDPLGDDERIRFESLRALAAAAEVTPDWVHGETLIRDSYFVDYARELAEDIGAVSPDAGWPLYAIDWDRAADDLLADYFDVEFDGVTYWIRS